MWRFSKSNGITEGFHRKMDLPQIRGHFNQVSIN